MNTITNKQRQAIFYLAAQAGMDDEERRIVQRTVTGKSSTSAMTKRDAERLIDHLQKISGHRLKPKRGAPAGDRAPLIAKIRRQLDGRSDAYAESILCRMRGLRRGTPCPLNMASPQELQKVVAALWYDKRRQTK